MPSGKPLRSRDKVRAYRERLRRRGLRPIQLWVPDVRSRRFAREAHRQSSLVGLTCSSETSRPSSMREIWTVAGGPDYVGEPRRAVILQDDAFARQTWPFAGSNTMATLAHTQSSPKRRDRAPWSSLAFP